MTKNFADRLLDEIEKLQNPSCIGLDPRIEDIPDFIKKENERKYNETKEAVARSFFDFNKMIIDATFDIVPAYKPQIAFYEKYGAKTIIIARFVPIIRTFAPFVAGIGDMGYKKFLHYNVIGGVAWISLCLGGGFLFGNIPTVKHNFTAVILAIIVISILPAVVEYLKHRYEAKKSSV